MWHNPIPYLVRNQCHSRCRGAGDNPLFGIGDAKDRGRTPQVSLICHSVLETGKPFRLRSNVTATASRYRTLSDLNFHCKICLPFWSHFRPDRRECYRRRTALCGGNAMLWIPQRRRVVVVHGRYGRGGPCNTSTNLFSRTKLVRIVCRII